MIEQLEAAALRQLDADISRETRVSVIAEHEGTSIEVRARRTRNGAAVLSFSYGGVRLERSVLLLLICPEAACDRSQAVKLQWQARSAQRVLMQRRVRLPMKGTPSFRPTPLFEEVHLEIGGRSCIARPASFVCLTVCPVQAHEPCVMRKQGWDVFEHGSYLAGGLTRDPGSQGLSPLFPSLDSVKTGLAQQQKTASLGGLSPHQV